jgi:hypothetical protein
MSISACGSHATYCQPSAAAGFIYADLRNELHTHLALQVCLFRVLLDECPFCFLQYTALPACCNCSFFYYLEFAWGSVPSPTRRWSVPPFIHCYKPSPLQVQWGMWHHICLLWLTCLFTVFMKECL